jgi:hypothetical protein
VRLSDHTINHKELQEWMRDKSLPWGGFPKQIRVEKHTFKRSISWFFSGVGKFFDERMECVKYADKFGFNIMMTPEWSYLDFELCIHVDESIKIPTPQSLIECKAVLSKYLEQKKIELL